MNKILPELGMPIVMVSYDRIQTPGQVLRVPRCDCVDVVIFNGLGGSSELRGVPLYQLDDGQCMPPGGYYCFFQNWFIKLMALANAPRLFGPFIAGNADPRFTAAAPAFPTPFERHEFNPAVAHAAPAGTPDPVHCGYLAGCIPTSQVLG